MRTAPANGAQGKGAPAARAPRADEPAPAAVSSGRRALATPGDDEQSGRDEIEPDQFHCGLAKGTSDAAGLTPTAPSSVLTRGTRLVRRAWLPSTA